MDLRKVLLADDEEDIRVIAELSLAQVGGLEVVLACSGPETVELARKHQPDLIVLDMMMPDCDGVQTLERLRSEPELERIPVVFMTAKAQPREVQRYLSIGAIGVISKPFDPMTLAAELRALVSVR